MVSPYRDVVLREFQAHKVPLNMDVEMPTIETIRKLVQSNQGVAFLPRMCVEQEIEQKHAVRGSREGNARGAQDPAGLSRAARAEPRRAGISGSGGVKAPARVFVASVALRVLSLPVILYGYMKKLSLAFAFTCVLVAQDKVDEATSARIRSEELEHSMIMHTVHMLTDRYGPRMTGTPNHEAAADWVIKETTAWGMKNAHLEAWDFGHPGWLNERASGFITAPVKENLKFEVLAWTPSTKGTVTGSAIQLIPPHGPEAPRAGKCRGRRARRTRRPAIPWPDAGRDGSMDRTGEELRPRQDGADRQSRRDSRRFRPSAEASA